MKDMRDRKYVKEVKVTPEMYKENKIIPFFAKRKIYFTISLSIMLIGILFMFINGVQLDIQFKGGALIKYTYVGEIDADKAAEVATESLGRPVTTQVTEDIASGEQRLILNIAGNYGLDATVREEFDTVLVETFPDAQLEQSESVMVEPFFGQRFLRNGIISILLAASLVLIYVWIRFKMMGGLSAGAMAIVALVHDVLIVFFTCVIFRIPIGESFVAVALSIIGYSINDTIVIYDRIRENAKTYIGYPVEAVTDLSITQSMMRSVNTNVAVMLSVSLVYFLAMGNGISSIMSFALPMAVGSISGCYSTICIAGPLWVMWKKKKGDDILFEEKKKPAPNY
ncbi:MAG: protein-export rane protein SecF [Herbinix sp.]|jgi:preprotein translocase SecF subunit|nr:protein-export rane protein SecF [Herbinix sp.]